jgi:UPF0755 protein
MKGLIHILAIAILTVALLFSFYYNAPTASTNKDSLILIKKGETTAKITQKLQDAQIITHPDILLYYLKIIQRLNSNYLFKSGEYLIKAHSSPQAIIKQFADGDVYLRKLTLVEGQTIHDLFSILDIAEGLTGEIDYNLAKEGDLLPETYTYTHGDTKNSLIKHMQDNMNEFLEVEWSNRQKNLPLKNIKQVKILASIVEKETGIHGERARIASVFTNRLNIRMPLQSDPTVIYAITKGKYKLERPLSKRDLRRKSPFNTYVNYGLPPEPIANPSKAALKAVLNPMHTNDLYFVSDGYGVHKFSNNLRDHNRNVRVLRAVEKKR